MSIEDKAQELEARLWEQRNVDRVNRPLRYEPGDAGYGLAECLDCGDDMIELRRAYGFQRCVHCQTVVEAGPRITRVFE